MNTITGVRIAAVACAVPRQVMKSDGGPHERAAKAVGVDERRHCAEQSLLELAYFAGYECLKIARLEPDAIDALVFVTQSQAQRIPSAACELHRDLGLKRDAPAFDVGLACSGYVYGLWIAASLRQPYVLLVVGDTISRFLDPSDSATYPIFGDAVSATLIEAAPQTEGMACYGGTDGRGAGSLFCADRLKMDGDAVFHFALSTVPELVAATTQNAYCDYYLFHQANRPMIERIAKKARLPLERVPFNIAKYGNTSSASIPLLMCDSEATEAIRTRKCRLAMFGFGAGFSFGGVLTDTDRIPLSVVEV